MKISVLFAAALAVATLAGCHSDGDKAAAKPAAAPAAAPKTASMGFVNAKCPMMPSHSELKVPVDYKGKKVGLCCKGCIAGWEKLTDEQKAEKLKAAM